MALAHPNKSFQQGNRVKRSRSEPDSTGDKVQENEREETALAAAVINTAVQMGIWFVTTLEVIINGEIEALQLGEFPTGAANSSQVIAFLLLLFSIHLDIVFFSLSTAHAWTGRVCLMPINVTSTHGKWFL